MTGKPRNYCWKRAVETLKAKTIQRKKIPSLQPPNDTERSHGVSAWETNHLFFCLKGSNYLAWGSLFANGAEFLTLTVMKKVVGHET